MVADGLTKGSADRSALSAIMDGKYELHHAAHEYKEHSPSSSTDRRVSFAHEVSVYESTDAVTTTASSRMLCASSGRGACGASATAALEGGGSFTTPRFSENDFSRDHSRDILWTPTEYWALLLNQTEGGSGSSTSRLMSCELSNLD